MPEDYARTVEITRSGRIGAAEIVTAQFPLSQAAGAFAAASSGEHVKVLVTRDGGDVTSGFSLPGR